MGGRGQQSRFTKPKRSTTSNRSAAPENGYDVLGKVEGIDLKQLFNEAVTNEIVMTNERMKHIREQHNNDVELYHKYGKQVATTPDVIFKDRENKERVNNKNTALFLKRIPNSNLIAVVSIAINDNKKNSIISFHRLGNSKIDKFKKNHEILYIRPGFEL